MPANVAPFALTLPFGLPGPRLMAFLLPLGLPIFRLTASRSGELVRMRPIDLNTAEPVWTYRPQQHKNAYRGHERRIIIGPRAQEVLRPFIAVCPLSTFIFNPQQAENERRAVQHAARKTPVIEQTPNLIWQLLTKRPQSILQMVPEHWRERFPNNVWAMTTPENQEWFDIRVKHLIKVPASVLGFSCEPVLGPIEFGTALDGIDPKRLWVIGGGESSQDKLHCRPTKHEWFTRLRDQCVERSIPFFFKQWGNFHEDGAYHAGEKSYHLLDGVTWDQFPE